jgi:hypothetical protein
MPTLPPKESENTHEERAFVNAITLGLKDTKADTTISLDDAKKRLLLPTLED